MQNPTRRDNLTSRRIGDELVIYDVARSKAHRLNQTTALVWRHCDGSMSVPELAQLVSREFGIPASEDIVWLALDQLDRAKLLQTPLTRSPDERAMSRRQAIALGLVGALAVLLPGCESATMMEPPRSKSPTGPLRDKVPSPPPPGPPPPPPPPPLECEDVTFTPERRNPGHPVLGECATTMKDARDSLDENIRKFCDSEEACGGRVCKAAKRKCRLRRDAEHEPTLVGNIQRFDCLHPDRPRGQFFLVGFVKTCPCQCVPEDK